MSWLEGSIVESSQGGYRFVGLLQSENARHRLITSNFVLEKDAMDL